MNIKKHQKDEIILVLAFAFFWETIEHYLETVSTSGIIHWFAWVEFWGNRIITDPLLVLLGYFIISKRRNLILFARIFSPLWLLVHVFIFPDSMYLHEILPINFVPFFWPKTTCWLDIWSIEHVVTGMSMGYLAINFTKSWNSKSILSSSLPIEGSPVFYPDPVLENIEM